MIKRLYIDGYKSFKDFEVELQPLSVIFGPNGSGKSNLIDAIQLLSALCTSGNITDAFKHHRGDALESFNYCDIGFDENMKKDKLEMAFEVDVELSNSSMNTTREIIDKKRSVSGTVLSERLEKYLRHKVKILATPETGYIKVLREKFIALDTSGKIQDDQTGLISSSLAHGTYELDEELHDFPRRDNWPPSTRISMAGSGAIYPSAYAFRLDVEKWRTYYLNPQVMRKYQPVMDVRSLASDGSDIAAFLNVLKDGYPNAYDNLIRALKTILPGKPELHITRPKPAHLALEIEEEGIRYSADLISDGTLRMLGLLAAVRPENNSTLIAFEEPENGVHPVRLALIADVFNNMSSKADQQIIITTHSPILPKYFYNENLFVCRKDKNHTSIEPFKSMGEYYRYDEIMNSLDDVIVRGDFGG